MGGLSGRYPNDATNRLENAHARFARLKNAGLWEAYSSRREALQSLGWELSDVDLITRNEFGEDAVEVDDAIGSPVAEKRFVAVCDAEEVLTRAEKGEKVSKKRGDAVLESRISVRDLNWVYHIMDIRSPDLKSAPSPGAVGLYRWAKLPSNREHFYRAVLSSVTKTIKSEETLETFLDDGRSELNLLDRYEETLD